jgi:hypothetical protein
MAYKVDKFNGTFLVSVADGTIDTSTNLRFVGKNYAGYGEIQNENFLHLMENFADINPPSRPVTGQIWYDTQNKKLKFYDGAKFKIAAGAEVSASQPNGLSPGEFWWDPNAEQLWTYTGNNFVLVGPAESPILGESGAFERVINDEFGTPKKIVEVRFTEGGEDTVVAIFSKESFRVANDVSIAGFTGAPSTDNRPDPRRIQKGINVPVDSNGNDLYFWGTAKNAERLGGRTAEEFASLVGGDFSALEINFGDQGYKVGTSVKELGVSITPQRDILFDSRTSKNFIFRMSGTTTKNIAVVTPEGVNPGANNEVDLGTTAVRWRNIYGNTISSPSFVVEGNGQLTGKTVGTHVGNITDSNGRLLINAASNEIGNADSVLRGTHIGFFTGDLTGTANNAVTLSGIFPNVAVPTDTNKTSVVVRTPDGDINARRFIGTVDRADLLKVGSAYIEATTTIPGATNKTSIATRDSSGDLEARFFRGTATAAQYADLAEKYLTDKDYDWGTVVVVGGEAEVTASSKGQLAIGVVSTNPAFMMNKDLIGGTYIALKGRVPVKVLGPVKKGDYLVADDNGTASASDDLSRKFAISLETNDNPEVKLVEAVVL